MKTIEIQSEGRNVEFTARAVYIDGVSYAYGNMTDLWYSEDQHCYGFTCDGRQERIFCDATNASVCHVIFSRINALIDGSRSAQTQFPADPPGESAPPSSGGLSGLLLRKGNVIIGAEAVLILLLIALGLWMLLLR